MRVETRGFALGTRLLLLALVHQAIVELLPHKLLRATTWCEMFSRKRSKRAHPAVGFPPNFAHDAKRALADEADDLVMFHVPEVDGTEM